MKIEISRCHSWGSALIANSQLALLSGNDASGSCSVSSQTDLHSFLDGPPERVGRSDVHNFLNPFVVSM